MFFCGAGVSQARAGLPGFLQLARSVVDILGVPSDSPAIALLEQAREAEDRTGITGLIPADRVFGILERDFLVRDVEHAVATALRPPEPPDLSAHRTLLDLATTPEGEVRIVTTNFDRLFHDCNPTVPSRQRPNLPHPDTPGDMTGIVYLHGKVDPNYQRATDAGFVLSSSAFGRAYLADGWATSFFRQIIRQYVVVFVGYSADDPPIQYLLEALAARPNASPGIYAFQSGHPDEAASRWRPKGVQAIAYGEHAALWPTLDAWAARARSPTAWYTTLAATAVRPPQELSALQRGQVAHMANTVEGLRRFSETTPAPPADWLCVFDPHIRYADPARSGTWRHPGPVIDPFDRYSIDADSPPPAADVQEHPRPRRVPSDAWDAFAPSRPDRRDSAENSPSYFRGQSALAPPPCSTRLWLLARWLGRIAHQPTAVWWAVRHGPLHPQICHHIRWAIRHLSPSPTEPVRQAWLYLFECWDLNAGQPDDDRDETVAQISTDGWNTSAVRRYGQACRPYLRAEPAWWWLGPIPPAWSDDIRLAELLHLRVVYPRTVHEDIDIPEEWRASVVAELRKNLDVARTLETEIGGLGLRHMAPISQSDRPNHADIGPSDGLSGLLRTFADRLLRLCDTDIEAARHELSGWPMDDDAVFARLRIWAASNSDLVPRDSFRQVLSSLSDCAFWDVNHQPDLLRTMASRWMGLPDEVRHHLEIRLLNGRTRRENEDDAEFCRRRARSTLDRLTWMGQHGCDFGSHVDSEISRLRELAPDWEPEHADDAAASMEGEGGFVTTRTEYSALLSESLATTLSRARELAGNRSDFLVEDDPYRGLSDGRPVRAFAALRVSAEQNEYPNWAWNTFLSANARKCDRPRLKALIAERLARFPTEAVSTFLGAASRWLRDVGDGLAQEYPSSFRVALTSLLDTLRQNPAAAGSGRLRGPGPRSWATEAKSSPTGMLAEAAFLDSEVRGLRARDTLPRVLLGQLGILLGLDGDLPRYAVAVLASRLRWLYAVDRDWSDVNLLSALDSREPEMRWAFWSGFFWGMGGTWEPTLYSRLKRHLLRLARERDERRRHHDQSLANLVLAGWCIMDQTGRDRCISNTELRDVLLRTDDAFRGAVLWHAERWLRQSDGEEAGRGSLVPELLRDVWPRQRSVKSPAMSARLFGLALGSEGLFREMAEVVEPLLSRSEGGRIELPRLRRARNVIDEHPRAVLGLLYAVLPSRTADWPYDTGAVLERIWEADETLREDSRLGELRRKSDAR